MISNTGGIEMKIRAFRFIAGWIALAIVAGLVSCKNSASPNIPKLIRISEIEVDEEDTSGKLEIEVHLYQDSTNVFLGCSGADQGLEGVDTSDVLYDVDAYFIKPGGGDQYLTLPDLEQKNIFIQVMEDDDHPCPGFYDPNSDDLVGTSDPFPASDFATPQVMAFGRVYHLKIGVFPSYSGVGN